MTQYDDIKTVLAAQKSKLQAVKLALKHRGYKSVGKPSREDGQWFKAPTSTDSVEQILTESERFRLN